MSHLAQKRSLKLSLYWTLSLSLLTIGFYTTHTSIQKPTVSPYEPAFRAGQCFIHNGLREPWSQDVDGMVAMVGYHHYLVMFRSQLNRSQFIDKDGWEEDMKVFDGQHHEAVCPKEWKHGQ